MVGMPNYKFTIAVSAYDCTGCGSCANVCPGKKGAKALEMKPFAQNTDEQPGFDYCVKLPIKQDVIDKFKESTVKGSQFKQPLLEFSGACGGCGETPYAKLVTQLFGDRMYIANATGCSSIWGNSSPSTPYTVNAKGQGPAWSNSLFEDAAEFGFGMLLAQNALRDSLKAKVEAMMADGKITAEGQQAGNCLLSLKDGAGFGKPGCLIGKQGALAHQLVMVHGEIIIYMIHAQPSRKLRDQKFRNRLNLMQSAATLV
jgi:pyruvate-ferredoxin/flavodoxin oxidoreductase